MSIDIEIKPGHQSFAIWYVYVDGEPVGDGYGSYRAAEDAAERIEERLPCGCLGQCDPYAHDTAPDWDGTPDGPYYTRCPECDGKIYEDDKTPHTCI